MSNTIVNIEIYLEDLYNQKKFLEIITFITTKIPQNEKSSKVLNLLGISRLAMKTEDQNNISLARNDFKNSFLKEKTSKSAIKGLSNFINSSLMYFHLKKEDVDFDEIISFHSEVKNFCESDLEINEGMVSIYRILNDSKNIAFYLNKIIESQKFSIRNLTSYAYWKCFDKNWSQSDFLKLGQFLDNNIEKINDTRLIKISDVKNSKLKIGFLSSDIIDGHSITYFLKTVLENYDKEKFEIYLILNQKKEDLYTDIFKNLVDKSLNIRNFSDTEAINTVRKLNLDIVVDLMGMTSGNRPSLFKNRISRIQINWLGYCNTSGLKNMDYIITDQNLIYSDEQRLYSEKIIYMDKIWNCHCGFDYKRKKTELPSFKNKYFTLGCFNNFSKINDNVLNTWSEILKKVKNSKLILKSSSKVQSNYRIKKKFEDKKIFESVIFLENTKSFEEHLNYYNKIDLALDTFPYNGVTTTFESVWKNVPVLTMKGYNFNSRCGESINKNLDLQYLIAKDEKDYIDKTIELSNNLEKLNNIRNKIFDRALDGPLFDTKSFSHNFFKELSKL